jgi:uncharacterized protein YlxW (UPF0749 family)
MAATRQPGAGSQPGDPGSRSTAEPAPAGRRLNLSSAMLDDLLNNPLDPGYRLAAQTAPARLKRWWDGPALWVACLAVGLLLVVSYQQQHRSAPAREAARKELITRVERLQTAGNALDVRAKALAADVAGLRDARLPGNTAELKALELNSGALPVIGPGVQIDLDEPAAPTAAASGRPGTTPQEQVAVLHDRDIRAVVNQLWAAGAEAVAVNGLRLTATSFIRFAGESVLVDFQPITAPYSIEAIGDRNGLLVAFADSSIARQLKTMAAVEGITFRFTGKSELRLQSVSVGQPHYAGRGASPSAGPPSAGQPSAGQPSAGPPSAGQPSAGPPSVSPSPSSTESPR